MGYSTDELASLQWALKGRPSESKLYHTWSPHNFVDRWITPTLVIHGTQDYRVVETEGIATFTALQQRGIPSELLIFRGGSQSLLSLTNLLAWHSNVFQWLCRWVGSASR